MRKFLIGLASAAASLALFAGPVLAAPPEVGTSPAAPNAQCGTAAASGAFNFQNKVYGELGTLGNGDSYNSSYFGLAGGSGGGQTGISNSSVCGHRQN